MAKAHTLVADFVRILHRTKSDPMAAAQYARSQRNEVLDAVFQKTAVGPLDRNDGAYILEFLNAVAEVLRPLTIIGRMPEVRRVAPNTRLAEFEVGATGDYYGENTPTGVIEMSLGATPFTFSPQVCSAISVVSSELLRVGTGGDVALANDCLRRLAAAINRRFVDPSSGAVAFVRDASITYGVTPQSFGGIAPTVTTFDTALRSAIASLASAEHDLQSVYLIGHPKLFAWLATARLSDGAPAYPNATVKGGNVAGLVGIPTTACAASGSPGDYFAVVAQADGVYSIPDQSPALDMSSAAAVQMSTTPTNSAQQLTSLWQNGLVGVRGRVPTSWHARTGAVALLSDMVL